MNEEFDFLITEGDLMEETSDCDHCGICSKRIHFDSPLCEDCSNIPGLVVNEGAPAASASERGEEIESGSKTGSVS